MKNFLSKNWRNIIYVICGIVIVFNLIKVCITPATIPEQFYKYGPTVESDLLDRTLGDAEGALGVAEKKTNEGIDKATETISNDNSSSDNNARMIVIAAIIIAVVFILATILDDSAEKSSAKKK